MHKCGLCCRAVSLSVHLSRSCILSKQINLSLNFFHHLVATPFQFFHTKRYSNIPTSLPPTGSSNVGGVGKNRDSQPISGFIACCQRCDRQVLYTQLDQTMASVWHLLLVSSVVCCPQERSMKCLWQEGSMLRQEQQLNLSVCSDKSEGWIRSN